jgi:hypothetical protein
MLGSVTFKSRIADRRTAALVFRSCFRLLFSALAFRGMQQPVQRWCNAGATQVRAYRFDAGQKEEPC